MFSPDLLKGSTRGLVLAVLAEEPMYGYQIIKALKVKSAEIFDFGEGTIYPVLHALEKEQLLTSEWRKENNFPERKYYALTKKGHLELKRHAKEWKVLSYAISQIYATC